MIPEGGVNWKTINVGGPGVVKSGTIKYADIVKMMALVPRVKPPIRDKQGRLWDAPNMPSQMSAEDYWKMTGGYVIPRKFMVPLLKLDALWRRRERKQQRRREHQKRKQ